MSTSTKFEVGNLVGFFDGGKPMTGIVHKFLSLYNSFCIEVDNTHEYVVVAVQFVAPVVTIRCQEFPLTAGSKFGYIGTATRIGQVIEKTGEGLLLKLVSVTFEEEKRIPLDSEITYFEAPLDGSALPVAIKLSAASSTTRSGRPFTNSKSVVGKPNLQCLEFGTTSFRKRLRVIVARVAGNSRLMTEFLEKYDAKSSGNDANANNNTAATAAANNNSSSSSSDWTTKSVRLKYDEHFFDRESLWIRDIYSQIFCLPEDSNLRKAQLEGLQHSYSYNSPIYHQVHQEFASRLKGFTIPLPVPDIVIGYDPFFIEDQCESDPDLFLASSNLGTERLALATFVFEAKRWASAELAKAEDQLLLAMLFNHRALAMIIGYSFADEALYGAILVGTHMMVYMLQMNKVTQKYEFRAIGSLLLDDDNEGGKLASFGRAVVNQAKAIGELLRQHLPEFDTQSLTAGRPDIPRDKRRRDDDDDDGDGDGDGDEEYNPDNDKRAQKRNHKKASVQGKQGPQKKTKAEDEQAKEDCCNTDGEPLLKRETIYQAWFERHAPQLLIHRIDSWLDSLPPINSIMDEGGEAPQGQYVVHNVHPNDDSPSDEFDRYPRGGPA